MKTQEESSTSIDRLTKEMEFYARKVMIPLILVFTYSSIQFIRIGNHYNYLLLLFGSILSYAAIKGYIHNVMTNSIKLKRGVVPMILNLGGLIPWVFGTYLTFICGLWSLTDLISDFSSMVILKSITNIFLGYVIVSNLYKITEISKIIKLRVTILKENDL